ncbi:hypothetical protein I3842_08G064100 [Carya illinoinensis]|uniref:Uncharacterized protein n=1 Tax=Carya illinoinensis TaxID=32201 RepID=A0A922J931_CARIL|nr:hypothetical protein I3842_08G064100 [Carya illinoinensis]
MEITNERFALVTIFQSEVYVGSACFFVTAGEMYEILEKGALCLLEVLSRSKWKLRRGNVSFWWDRWMDDGPIGESHGNVVSPDMKVKECWVENEWDEDMLI